MPKQYDNVRKAGTIPSVIAQTFDLGFGLFFNTN